MCVYVCRKTESLCTCLSDPEPTAISSSARRFSNSAIYRDETRQHMVGSDNSIPKDTHAHIHTPLYLLSCLLPSNILTLLSWEGKQKHVEEMMPLKHLLILCVHSSQTLGSAASVSLSTLPWQTRWIFPALVCCVARRVPLHLGPWLLPPACCLLQSRHGCPWPPPAGWADACGTERKGDTQKDYMFNIVISPMCCRVRVPPSHAPSQHMLCSKLQGQPELGGVENSFHPVPSLVPLCSAPACSVGFWHVSSLSISS